MYQALSALAQRGAVMVDEGETRIYRATAPAELLRGLKRDFELARTQAQHALAGLESSVEDDRIYQLKTPTQVYERAEEMISGAREILLFDLFPQPLVQLTPHLSRAQARGVTVAGLCYGEKPDASFHLSQTASRDFAFARWPGLQLSVVADAREHLLALLSADGSSVHHGVWSDSAYLACLQHSGLAAEIRLLARAQPGPLEHLSLLQSYPAGLRALIGPPPPDCGTPA